MNTYNNKYIYNSHFPADSQIIVSIGFAQKRALWINDSPAYIINRRTRQLGLSAALMCSCALDPSLKLQQAIRYALHERVLLNLQGMSYRPNYLDSRNPPLDSRRDDKITLRTSSHAYVVKSELNFRRNEIQYQKRRAVKRLWTSVDPSDKENFDI